MLGVSRGESLGRVNEDFAINPVCYPSNCDSAFMGTA
jgi:hypothetical protein